MDLALRPSTEKHWNGTPRAYQVLQDGQVIGSLKKEYRPKSCGGPAFAFKRQFLGMPCVQYFPTLDAAKCGIRKILA